MFPDATSRLRPCLMRQIAIVGTTSSPIKAPHIQYVVQLHGAPVSASGAQLRAAPTTFATSTAIIPPPTGPMTAAGHPTPT